MGLFQTEAVARAQNQRQLSTEGTANDLARSLAAALTQAALQTLGHNELSQQHQVCLEAINERLQSIGDSHRALEQTAEALITPRQRGNEQQAQGSPPLQQHAVSHDHASANRQKHDEPTSRNEQVLRGAIDDLNLRMRQMERQENDHSSGSGLGARNQFFTPPPTAPVNNSGAHNVTSVPWQ